MAIIEAWGEDGKKHMVKRGQIGGVPRVAAENICSGDYCRPMLDGTVRLLRDGDGLRASDVVALHDAPKGETVKAIPMGGA